MYKNMIFFIYYLYMYIIYIASSTKLLQRENLIRHTHRQIILQDNL